MIRQSDVSPSSHHQTLLPRSHPQLRIIQQPPIHPHPRHSFHLVIHFIPAVTTRLSFATLLDSIADNWIVNTENPSVPFLKNAQPNLTDKCAAANLRFGTKRDSLSAWLRLAARQWSLTTKGEGVWERDLEKLRRPRSAFLASPRGQPIVGSHATAWESWRRYHGFFHQKGSQVGTGRETVGAGVTGGCHRVNLHAPLPPEHKHEGRLGGGKGVGMMALAVGSVFDEGN